MISKILIPVDGSEYSMHALDQALFLAKKTGSSITVIHVIESPPTVYVQSQKVLNELLADYRKESAAVLDKCKKIADRQGVKIQTALMEGNAAVNIISYSEKEKFDLIVIGSRGFGQLKELVLGSTSSKVLHHAKTSVMVVK